MHILYLSLATIIIASSAVQAQSGTPGEKGTESGGDTIHFRSVDPRDILFDRVPVDISTSYVEAVIGEPWALEKASEQSLLYAVNQEGKSATIEIRFENDSARSVLISMSIPMEQQETLTPMFDMLKSTVVDRATSIEKTDTVVTGTHLTSDGRTIRSVLTRHTPAHLTLLVAVQ